MDADSPEGGNDERDSRQSEFGSKLQSQSTREQSHHPVYGTINNINEYINDNLIEFYYKLVHKYLHFNHNIKLHHHHGPDDDLFIHNDDRCSYNNLKPAVIDKLYGPSKHDHDDPKLNDNKPATVHNIKLTEHNPYGHDAAGNWKPGD